jgi:hypothetical protein
MYISKRKNYTIDESTSLLKIFHLIDFPLDLIHLSPSNPSSFFHGAVEILLDIKQLL